MPPKSADACEAAHPATSLPEPSLTLRAGFKHWFRDSLARQGLARTLSSFAHEAVEFVRDSLPPRQRQRWDDIDFDCDFRVDTTAARLGIRTRFLGVVLGGAYQPSDPALFHRMLDALAIDFREFTFIDLGSGKGRALLMASDYPFRRIMGVELLPDLHRIALENIARYHSPAKKCSTIESCCADAAVFKFPPEPTVLYIFNPFPESGLATVIDNLERSLVSSPRPVHVVYHNPILEHVLGASPVLRRINGDYQFAIYANR